MRCKEFYSQYFDIHSPFVHQQQTWDLILNNRVPLLIKAPTGSGKTEAILAPFLAQFLKNNFPIAPRLIYVLPMRVLVNNVAERIKSYVSRISSNITVRVQHGDVRDSPFFISDIVVTTLDQFVYGFARASPQVGRHIDIPAGAIASSLVVFDEAHMYRDGFTFSIMRALMEILYASNIPFVVMTASMPASLEDSLFEQIKEVKDDQRVVGGGCFNGKLEIILKDEPLYQDENVWLDDEILDEISKHRTLIILNQVKRAQRVYEFLKSNLSLEDSQIVLLHSRFTFEDRLRHEARALSLLPSRKHSFISNETGVVVATQVLEAGIDFSAELLLTELAPADALVQRAGRCARYPNQTGKMLIFRVEEGNSGHLPYESEHLTKTFDWLKARPGFNIRDFKQVCEFVDSTLNYQASDYEARETLVDLYECVLYADTEPANIQVRKGKPVTLVVLDVPERAARKTETQIEEMIKNNPELLRNKAISTDISVAWKLFRDDNQLLRWGIRWEYNPKKKASEFKVFSLVGKGAKKAEGESLRIMPFGTYILDARNYSSNKGIDSDVSCII